MSMDDAGNGLRGRRATASPRLLGLLRERYGLDDAGEASDLGGSSCLNLRVSIGGSTCVARVYRPYVSAERLDAIQTVRRELARGGIPCAELIRTRDGKPWTEIDGRLVEMEAFVDRDGEMDSWERLEAGLPWLGRIHSVLRAVEVGTEGKTPRFANHVEPFDALDWTVRAARRVRAWGPSPAELRLMEEAEELARRLTEAERDITPALPRQLVHGDFWDNNVFFRQGRVVLVTDFDFMGERARIDDLALTLYYTNAYDRGLDEPLSPVERAALPLALARQPLWWVGRWLALLDDEETARRGLAEMAADVDWALQIAREPGRWVAGFVRGCAWRNDFPAPWRQQASPAR